MNARRFPRSLRQAFPQDWAENCFGVERMAPTRPGWLVLVLRWLRGVR